MQCEAYSLLQQECATRAGSLRPGAECSAREEGSLSMATTSELKEIMRELELVDIGDAASYLGEEAMPLQELPHNEPPQSLLEHAPGHPATCTCIFCQLLHVL
jgi:hypothetical protein